MNMPQRDGPYSTSIRKKRALANTNLTPSDVEAGCNYKRGFEEIILEALNDSKMRR